MNESFKINAIEWNGSTQCRAGGRVDRDTVIEYMDAMTAGAVFPPVVLFGNAARAWIGDGWQRIAAAMRIGAKTIDADVRNGGRIDALRFALSANATHGNRRTNADKRRCVEVALAEFSSLSSRQIADLCGVGHDMVTAARALAETANAPTVTTSDGRQYPARRAPRVEPAEPPRALTVPPDTPCAPPCNGMHFASLARMQLEQIKPNDTERAHAFSSIQTWLDENR